MKEKDTVRTKSDVILIGAGIMSATLGVLLKELAPHLTITVLERLDAAARKVPMLGIMPGLDILPFVN